MTKTYEKFELSDNQLEMGEITSPNVDIQEFFPDNVEQTGTKTIEFDVTTRIIELEKIVQDAQKKEKLLPQRRKIAQSINLLKSLLATKNEKAKHRVVRVIKLLESLL